MLTNKTCWFFEQASQGGENFPGAFEPNPVWLVENEVVLLFYVHKWTPFTIIYNCAVNTFEKPKAVDFSLLKLQTFDCSIQKVFYFQNRLLLVKNAVQSDKNLLLITNTNLAKLFPIKIDLPCDFIHNGIALFESSLYFFGGVSLSDFGCHSRFFKLELSQLKLVEINVDLNGERPSARCRPTLEGYKDHLFMASGYPNFPFFEGWNTCQDVWTYSISTTSWRLFKLNSVELSNIKSVARDRDKICILQKPKNFEVHLIQMETFRSSVWTFANNIYVSPGVSSKVLFRVPVRQEKIDDFRGIPSDKASC